MLKEQVENQLRLKGWTKGRLVSASGVNKNSVHNFLRGRSISIESLEKILRALGLEVRPASAVDYEREKANAVTSAANQIYAEVTSRLDDTGVLKPQGNDMLLGDSERQRVFRQTCQMIARNLESHLKNLRRDERRRM